MYIVGGGQFWRPMLVQLQNLFTNSTKFQKIWNNLVKCQFHFSFKQNLLKYHLPKIQFPSLGGRFMDLLILLCIFFGSLLCSVLWTWISRLPCHSVWTPSSSLLHGIHIPHSTATVFPTNMIIKLAPKQSCCASLSQRPFLIYQSFCQCHLGLQIKQSKLKSATEFTLTGLERRKWRKLGKEGYLAPKGPRPFFCTPNTQSCHFYSK